MKGLATNVPRALTIGTMLTCDDNSGAKKVTIIGVKGGMTKRGRLAKAGIGDVVIVAVKAGTPQMVKKVEKAMVIRQKKSVRRASGLRVMFEDNACALIDDAGLPKGTEIKGMVAREVAERYPKVAAVAWGVI